MKLVIATYGTEGDTRPLAALRHALTPAHDAPAAAFRAVAQVRSAR